MSENQTAQPVEKTGQKKRRILSIDALRGLDMFWIIGGEGLFAALFVLTGWSFWHTLAGQMEHSVWHGFTVYDLIFPLFIFLSGVSLGLSVKNITKLPGDQRLDIYKKVLRRLLLLLSLGVIYNHGWGTGMPASIDEIRYASVLGRIGIAWFIAAMIAWHFSLRTQVIITVGIALGYWALLALVSVDGFGGQYTLEHSLNAWVDQHLLPGITYQNLPVDPEGLLSSFPAAINAMIGVFVGRMMMTWQQTPKLLMRNLVSFGVALLVIGWVWDGVMPVNTTLWTSSFAMVTSGYSVLLMALFYLMCDVLDWQKFAKPFMVIGVNSIAIYMASSLINWTYSATSLFGGLIAGTPAAWHPLLQVIALLAVQWWILYWMYNNKVFVKI